MSFTKGLIAGFLIGWLLTFIVLTERHKRDIQELQDLAVNAIKQVGDTCVSKLTN